MNERFISRFNLKEDQLVQLRRFHLTMSVLFLTTILYWFIDIHIVQLPEPVIPYIFFTLIISMLFNLRVAVATSILSVFLIEYFLFRPRYDIAPQDHPGAFSISIVGITLSLIVGYFIRKYQENLEKDKEELKVLIKARDEFASVAAHDLKTPLTTIKLYLQSMNANHKTVNKALTNSISTIDRETDKLLTMIDRLMDFSKIQEGKLNLKLEQLDLVKLCKDQLRTIKRLYPDHKFIFSANVNRAMVVGDKITMERILTNLLTNAAKYSPSKTRIELILKRSRSDFQVSVKDQGVGIDETHLDKLFEPFYQVDNGQPGVGLGLHITKQLVELHKGKIGVKSQPGKGSTFFFNLPISRVN